MIRLETATEDDLFFMFNTRNMPEVYAGFYQQDAPLDWDRHVEWFRSRNQDWRTFRVMLATVLYTIQPPIGIVTIGQLDHWSPEIGYYIHPDNWGRGHGKEAVRIALEYIKDQDKQYCHTTVLLSNYRSIRLLQSLGFEYMAEARPGEVWMTKEL